MKAALEPLLERRRGQVTDAARLKELDYVAGESRRRWLARHGVAAGNIDPTRVSLLPARRRLPREDPVRLLPGAVGRVRGRAALVRHAGGVRGVRRQRGRGGVQRARAALAAGDVLLAAPPVRSGDAAECRSAGQAARGRHPSGGRVRCSFESISGDAATHEALAEVLARRDATAPGLLFTASHGMGFPAGHADQRAQQGALVCQDWAGPRAGSIARGQYFAGADVPDDAEVAGLFAFVFACFGGGTPARDRFAHTPGEEPPKLAEAPFAAALPQRLLAHPGGGALGCIAHVERAWGDSIVESGAGPQLIPFENAIGNVLAGKPIGLALKDFSERFAALSVSLAGLLEQIGDGMIVPDRQLAKAWIQRNDAEGYALFGDPAARLRLEQAA